MFWGPFSGRITSARFLSHEEGRTNAALSKLPRLKQPVILMKTSPSLVSCVGRLHDVFFSIAHPPTMPSTRPQYDEVSQEDQRASQRLPGSLTTDSPESSEEHSYSLSNKVESSSSSRPSDALVSSPVGSADQREYEPRKIHWVSPTIMVVSLLCGVALTVGHHAYYKTLDGQEVGSSNSQQWSLR